MAEETDGEVTFLGYLECKITKKGIEVFSGIDLVIFGLIPIKS